MEDLILETKNLTKYYGRHQAICNLSLQVKRNSIYGLLGPNGAGKSTTLKLIVGLLRPTGGSILFNRKPWKRAFLSEISSLIESPALYGNLTARENLMVHTKLLRIPETRIDEVLGIVDLKDTGKKRVSQFSLGMKQRLGIASALLNNPKLLILDEPTNGLDPFGIQELRELISSFPSQGITVILSSHILSEVAQVVDEIGIISNGKLLFQGVPDSRDESLGYENLEQFFTEVVLKGGRG
ncbi:lantibiotic protection ABC transporter ATP-binding protein [Luxibacter massiliensis]|uniref:lantibiotic protection ABC transporter ATP-binding protein n=1 Tax=Luxibacter massiliensis TaxID=2219695 RepID=UPI000F068E04|nr:lantibiotic protection ABC transporter ATP-binding protein [Luxibacter massiliensis]